MVYIAEIVTKWHTHNGGTGKQQSKIVLEIYTIQKQDNIGVSPVKSNGHLVNDSKRKAVFSIETTTKHCLKHQNT